MKWTLVSLLAAFFSSPLALANVGEYRGYELTQEILGERLLLEGNRVSLVSYVGNQTSLATLLGGYVNRSGNNVFINGQPNALNMLVWHLALASFAKHVAFSCGPVQPPVLPPLPLQPYFASVLQTTCRWPQPEAMSESNMRAFWLSLMDYDAPEEEFLAWREFFLHSAYAGKPAWETVPALVLSILYHPHFLLRK